MRLFRFVPFLILLAACSRHEYQNPHVVIESAYGDIEAELYPEKAPRTVAAFLTYVDNGYYRQTSFYRVLKDDDMPDDYNSGLIQGGLWPKKKDLPGIIHESTKQSGLSHLNGTLSLARLALNTATTEFFICVGDRQELDAGGGGTADGEGYAAFGRVIHGMDVVRAIQSAKSTGENFDHKILIRNIRRL